MWNHFVKWDFCYSIVRTSAYERRKMSEKFEIIIHRGIWIGRHELSYIILVWMKIQLHSASKQFSLGIIVVAPIPADEISIKIDRSLPIKSYATKLCALIYARDVVAEN